MDFYAHGHSSEICQQKLTGFTLDLRFRFSGTIETIQDLEPDATVITDGLTISENDIPDAESDVNSWLEELGY